MLEEENSNQQSAVGGQQPIVSNVTPINGDDDFLDNLLVRDDPPAPADSRPPTADSQPIYDASARNRFEYEVEGGVDIAHVFGPLSDERYMQWIRELKVKGNQDDITEESREASVALYDDIIIEVENIEYPAGADWKALLDSQYKLEAVNDLLAVAIVEPDAVKGKLGLGGVADHQTIETECWFNGRAATQKHILQKRSFDLEKKYARIQAKRLKQEATKGLSRKPQIEYIPQDDKLGGLYDEMLVSVDGYSDQVPLRFKVLVIHYIFASKSKAKSLGK